jgi:nucleoside-diphosphate-sugar epimerase
MNKKTFLVTGGAGFIGSHLCESLIKDGHRVICIDNFLTGSQENLAELEGESRFLLIKADVTKSLPDIFGLEKIDGVFHLASPASPNINSPISYMTYPLETMSVNSFGTWRMLNLAKKNGAKFLFASTSEIYGEPREHPQKESYWGNVNSVGPRACYDESKRFGEALTMTYGNKMEVDTRIVRIFNTYGPRMDPKDGRAVVNFMVQAIQEEPMTIYGDGKQTRSFCYVDDMVKGIKKSMMTNRAKGKVINLGNPDEYKIIELAEKVKRMVKSNSEIKFGSLPEDDPTRRRPSITRAKKLLNWEPKVSLTQGLEKTITWFKDKLEK